MNYTGIGSRKTPQEILEFMTQIAKHLDHLGYHLRSGGAKGADTAFSKGSTNYTIFTADQATSEAMQIAQKYHKAWDKMGDYAKKLHARNTFQVLGINLNNPSKFLICWTPDGAETHSERSIQTGGTGTAISIADKWDIKIYNLALPHAKKHWEKVLSATC